MGKDQKIQMQYRVWQIDFKWCTIMSAKSATNVHQILPMNFTHTILRFLQVCVIQNDQIIVCLCCILKGIKNMVR